MAKAATKTPAIKPEPTSSGAFSSVEWFMAWRYLRARRKQGFISVIAGFSFLGIALGVATLIVVMSVMNGFRHDLLDKIIGVNGHIFLQSVEKPFTDFGEVTARVRKVDGVKLALPLIEGQALASSPSASSGVLVRGLREADIKTLPGIAGNVKHGTLDGFDTSAGVAIGARLADQLALQIGDTITIVSPKGAETPFGVAPRIKSYPIVAIFQIGMSSFDGTFVFMPLSEAQSYFNKEGVVTLIEVYVANPDTMDAMRQAIGPAIQRPMIMTDWRQRDRTFFDALAVERNVMFLILTLIVLVAALNIISGLIMLVQDKGSDIAVLRTMGATRGMVMRVFLISGASIGVFGTFAGFVLGLLVANNVEHIRQALNQLMGANIFPAELYFLSQLPSRVESADVIAVVSMTLTLSLLATIYPSWRAAKLDPVEALRYE